MLSRMVLSCGFHEVGQIWISLESLRIEGWSSGIIGNQTSNLEETPHDFVIFCVFFCHCFSKMSMSSTKHLQHDCSMRHLLLDLSGCNGTSTKAAKSGKGSDSVGRLWWSYIWHLVDFCTVFTSQTFTMSGTSTFNKKWPWLFCFCDFKSLLWWYSFRG